MNICKLLAIYFYINKIYHKIAFLLWSGRIEHEDFFKKKNTLGSTLGNSPAAAAPVSSPPTCPAFPWNCGGGMKPKS